MTQRKDQFVPHVAVSDGLAAMKFYAEVFGGLRGDSMIASDGKRLLHGEVLVDGHKLFISDEFEQSEGGTVRTPESLGGTCVRITLMVDDADSVMKRALERGARELMPVQNMFWGARYGKFLDPFGHEWGINQQIADLSADEERQAADHYFGKGKR